MIKHLLVLPFLIISLFVGCASRVHAQDVTIAVQTALVDFTPTANDYRHSTIEKPNAIGLNINSTVAYKVIVSGDDTGGLRNVDVNVRKSGTSEYVNLSGGIMKELLFGSPTSGNGDDLILDLKLFIPHANSGNAYQVGGSFSNEITFTITDIEE
jgi:hypothetical protein